MIGVCGMASTPNLLESWLDIGRSSYKITNVKLPRYALLFHYVNDHQAV